MIDLSKAKVGDAFRTRGGRRVVVSLNDHSSCPIRDFYGAWYRCDGTGLGTEPDSIVAPWEEESASGTDCQGQTRASGRQTPASQVQALHPEREPQPVQENNLPDSPSLSEGDRLTEFFFPKEKPVPRVIAVDLAREKCACCVGTTLVWDGRERCPECGCTGCHEQAQLSGEARLKPGRQA